MKLINIESLAQVARRLEPLDERFAFLGGSVIPLLVDNPSLVSIRPTKDVDVIIEVVSRLDFSKIEEKLRSIGFKHDMSEGAPKCRWLVEDITVDVMPANEETSEWGSKWFSEALTTSQPVKIEDDTVIDVVTVPFFLATKLDAFSDRGKEDFYGSHDVEDIITVLDGRSNVVAEVANAPHSLSTYIGTRFAELVANSDFMESLSGHLLPDPASQARLPDLRETIKRIAGMGGSEE